MMMARTQVSLDPELRRRAQKRAAERGVSFAHYVRELVESDLGPKRRRAPVTELFALGASSESDVARDKDALLGAAIEAERGPRRKR